MKQVLFLSFSSMTISYPSLYLCNLLTISTEIYLLISAEFRLEDMNLLSENSKVSLEQKNFSKSPSVPDGEILENDKSKSVTDTSEIKTISSVNLVREWKKSKTAEGKRRRSSGSGRRKRYDTDRV